MKRRSCLSLRTITRNVTGELEKAVQVFQQEIESYPKDIAAHANLGITYDELGQYEKAAEVTRQAIEPRPSQCRSVCKPRQ